MVMGFFGGRGRGSETGIGAERINDLLDVSIGNVPAAGSVLAWNEVSSQWVPTLPEAVEPGAVVATLADLTDVNIDGTPPGAVLTWVQPGDTTHELTLTYNEGAFITSGLFYVDGVEYVRGPFNVSGSPGALGFTLTAMLSAALTDAGRQDLADRIDSESVVNDRGDGTVVIALPFHIDGLWELGPIGVPDGYTTATTFRPTGPGEWQAQMPAEGNATAPVAENRLVPDPAGMPAGALLTVAPDGTTGWGPPPAGGASELGDIANVNLAGAQDGDFLRRKIINVVPAAYTSVYTGDNLNPMARTPWEVRIVYGGAEYTVGGMQFEQVSYMPPAPYGPTDADNLDYTRRLAEYVLKAIGQVVPSLNEDTGSEYAGVLASITNTTTSYTITFPQMFAVGSYSEGNGIGLPSNKQSVNNLIDPGYPGDEVWVPERGYNLAGADQGHVARVFPGAQEYEYIPASWPVTFASGNNAVAIDLNSGYNGYIDTLAQAHTYNSPAEYVAGTEVRLGYAKITARVNAAGTGIILRSNPTGSHATNNYTPPAKYRFQQYFPGIYHADFKPVDQTLRVTQLGMSELANYGPTGNVSSTSTNTQHHRYSLPFMVHNPVTGKWGQMPLGNWVTDWVSYSYYSLPTDGAERELSYTPIAPQAYSGRWTGYAVVGNSYNQNQRIFDVSIYVHFDAFNTVATMVSSVPVAGGISNVYFRVAVVAGTLRIYASNSSGIDVPIEIALRRQ